MGEQDEENHEDDVFLDFCRCIEALKDDAQFLQEDEDGRDDAQDIGPDRNVINRAAPLDSRHVGCDDIYCSYDEEDTQDEAADVAQAVPFFTAAVLVEQGKSTGSQNRFGQYHRYEHEENQKPRFIER